jgi:hypothetical protein
MTDTVTGVTRYQWYASGQWRVMSQTVRQRLGLSDGLETDTGGHLEVAWIGSRLSDRLQCHRLDHRHEPRTWLRF